LFSIHVTVEVRSCWKPAGCGQPRSSPEPLNLQLRSKPRTSNGVSRGWRSCWRRRARKSDGKNGGLDQFGQPPPPFPSVSLSTSRLKSSFGSSRALCNQVAQAKCCRSRRANLANLFPWPSPPFLAPSSPVVAGSHEWTLSSTASAEIAGTVFPGMRRKTLGSPSASTVPPAPRKDTEPSRRPANRPRFLHPSIRPLVKFSLDV
jgi:hypothetical protein